MSVTSVICFDVDGTLTHGVRGPAIDGAASALRLLRAAFPVRLVTNTTSVPHRALARHLVLLGLLEDESSLLTPATVAARVLPERGHDSGILIAEPAARDDYRWFREDPAGPAVVLATEAHDLRVGELQPAFRRLLEGTAFYTLQRNRYFRRDDELVTDLGPLAAFFTYASGVEAETLGKPSPLLYDAIARENGADRGEIVMVGDDAEFDVSASVALGMRGVLVRTGKYREGDETRVTPAPSAVLGSVADVPAWLGIV
ncbi:MAG TPA: HAD hydrolase-like protein [Candidatus Eisenbacteria bacterium]|nr:HAD hydrolase-like protein [Candidatus Eisenbacteria bacterium]